MILKTKMKAETVYATNKMWEKQFCLVFNEIISDLIFFATDASRPTDVNRIGAEKGGAKTLCICLFSKSLL